MKSSDKKIISQAKKDPACFEKIYNKYYQKVYNYFWYRLGYDREKAEEMMQEVFLRAFSKLKTYKHRNYSYLTYLLTIARNLFINYLKKEKESVSWDEIKNLTVSGNEILHNILDAQYLYNIIERYLSGNEREAVLLRYREGLSIKEISQVMRKSENAVKLLLSRARKKLKERYVSSNVLSVINDTTPYKKPKFLKVKE